MSVEKFNEDLYNDQQFKFRPRKIYQAYAQLIWEIFKPKSLMDLGCANGYVLDYLQAKGVRIKGLEPAKAAYKYMPKRIKARVLKLDLRNQLNLEQHEVVNFTEVAEHIDKKYESTMLKNAVNSVNQYLIISWSDEIYQDKPTEHVNPRPPVYVKKKLKQLGLYFEPELTQILKQRLNRPVFKDWQHWAKNVLVFSKINPEKTVLISHYEYFNTYLNKNIGYFMQTCLANGFSVKFLTQKINDNPPSQRNNNLKIIKINNLWPSLRKKYHRVWLYPYEKNLIMKLLLLKLYGNKIIIKMDSQIVRPWRARLISQLTDWILVESDKVAEPFGKSRKLKFYAGGLSQKNINLINNLNIKRQKQVLFAGRIVRQKGVDRLKQAFKSIDKSWRLKVVSNLSGKKYYQEILKSSLVVLPTRGEGFPNVFSDAYFCRRLFLTTTEAKCREAILNKDFYVTDFKKGLNKIITNLDWYYRNYDRLYDSSKFVVTDKAFLSLITNQG